MNRNYKRRIPSAGTVSASRKLYEIRRHYSNLMLLVILLMLLVIAGSVTIYLFFSAHTYVLTDGERYESVRLFPGSVEAAQKAAGFDDLEVVAQREGDKTTYLTLGRALSAQIITRDQTFSVPFTACTVEELLKRNGVTVGPDDIVTPALDEWLVEDTDITVVAVSYHNEEQTVPIPFEVEMHTTDSLDMDTQRIVRYGQNGEKKVVYRVTQHNGVDESREILSEKQTLMPVNCIIAQGTREKKEPPPPPPEDEQTEALDDTIDPEQGPPPKPKPAPPESVSEIITDGPLSTAGRTKVWSVPAGIFDNKKEKTITAGDGSRFKYSAVIDVKATAYHRVEEGGLITASGTTTQYGTVAVDPHLIPLGSRVYVVSDGGQSWSYGPGLAEDTGGLIKGNRIDLFFMTGEEAVQFGVRPAKIYILE